MISLTKEQILPASLLRLLLIRAGIEQNPGPWNCNICQKRLNPTSVQCSTCNNWLHIKCSGLDNSRQRSKKTTWTGPCCTNNSVPPANKSPSHRRQRPRDQPPSRPVRANTPPPAPPPVSPTPSHSTITSSTLPYDPEKELKILQYNINGISNKIDETLVYMEENNILIAAIQETKLTEKSKPLKTPNYTLVRKDRGTDKGGGLAFLVHESVKFQVDQTPPILENDKHLESQTILIPGKTDNLKIRNVYIPPVSSCTPQYTPPLSHLFDNLNDTSYVLGDLNCHHEAWLTEATSDHRGRLLVDEISGLNFGILNEDLPTRLAGQTSSSPDVSLASSNIIPITNWSVEVKLSSDHLPITLTLSVEIKKIKSENRVFMNFKKADWNRFNKYTEKHFSRLRTVTDVHKSEKYFRKIVNKAAKKFIPAGRILKVVKSIPTEAANMMKERDRIRKINPKDPMVKQLNRDINTKIIDHKREKWREHLDNITASKSLWPTIKDLTSQQQKPTNNQGIKFNDQVTNDPVDIANNLNRQFTPGSETKPVQESRTTDRNLKKKTIDPEIIITTDQVTKAIKKSKASKALGPDDLSPVMLKHLGNNGIKFLTDIFNKCINQSIIPDIWKIGRIIPLLKPGKAADNGPSYRPISLLSPAAKILEAVILPELTEAINLAGHQHGFRKKHSTTTALTEISEHICTGMNKTKPIDRTVSVAIDLSRAFDTVNHHLLLQDILELQLNNHIKRFLCSYLHGRKTYVEFRGVQSKYRKMKQGVPQGGVLSPTLFNLYMSKMPQPPGNIKLVTYADDSNTLNSGTNINKICEDLNVYLDTLDTWFKSRNLFISPAKSSATLFTTSPHEVNLQLPIRINNEVVPTVKQPKFLGITFDNTMSFSYHTSNLKSRLQGKNNVLKALTGTTWGKDKEVLTTTYKAIGQSLINYGCPVWTPNLHDSHWKTLQTCQNSALKIITGCHKIASFEHIHSETKIMPVRDHCEMLSEQYLLATQQETHPNSIDLSSPPPARLMKETLKTRFGTSVQTIVPMLNEDNYKAKIKDIHTKSVQQTIVKLGSNPIINQPPPNINKDEKQLPRTTRATLSQLRSGYSRTLNSYMARIDSDTEDRCPDCLQAGHTTLHLFDCPAKPTDLTALALWNRPLDVAQFLDLPRTEPFDDNG